VRSPGRSSGLRTCPWPRRPRRGYDVRRLRAGPSLVVDERVSDLFQQVDLPAEILHPFLRHLVSQLRELDLRLAQLVALDLLVALTVGDQGQCQVPDAEQDDHEVVGELAHVQWLPRAERPANHRETAAEGRTGAHRGPPGHRGQIRDLATVGGTAAAVANAVHHATGIRDLPIRPTSCRPRAHAAGARE
jgi:hypothetical protein